MILLWLIISTCAQVNCWDPLAAKFHFDMCIVSLCSDWQDSIRLLVQFSLRLKKKKRAGTSQKPVNCIWLSKAEYIPLNSTTLKRPSFTHWKGPLPIFWHDYSSICWYDAESLSIVNYYEALRVLTYFIKMCMVICLIEIPVWMKCVSCVSFWISVLVSYAIKLLQVWHIIFYNLYYCTNKAVF